MNMLRYPDRSETLLVDELAELLNLSGSKIWSDIRVYPKHQNLNTDKFEHPLMQYKDDFYAVSKDTGKLQKVAAKEWQKETPREYTEDEVRDQFLKHVWTMIEYWLKVPDAGERKVDAGERYRMWGFAHSLLAMIDGCSVGIPGFKVIPTFHPDDKEYLKKHGENWYPEDVDIAGGLHELLHKYDPENK